MVLTIILGTISKNFHDTIIMGPGRYDYHGFMIIAQPYSYPSNWCPRGAIVWDNMNMAEKYSINFSYQLMVPWKGSYTRIQFFNFRGM